jgi:3-phenylpropionate/trans-cinnamate dioxygenase ferredoxin reductase subunit
MGIVIVGGGLAGATAAGELREQGYDEPVTIFAEEQHLPYERPPLSKSVLLGKKPLATAYVHDADWYRDQRIEVVLGTSVTSIAPREGTLTTSGGTADYDRLILATGSTPRHLAVADRSGRPVHYLRTMEDSQALKASFAEGPRVTIVGGGWIGLEVAAAARLSGCEVTLYEAAELPLLGVLGHDVAQVFADLHRSHGVDLRLGESVSEPQLEAAGVVVVGIGVTPNTELAENAGLEVDNGVLVDSWLRTSDPHVFAIGDIANHDHPVLGRRVRVEHWDNAIEQGKVAARNALGAGEAYERLPYFFTDQYDLGMEYVGNVGPDGYDDVVIDGDVAGAFRAYWLRNGTVLAAMHANDWDASDAIRDSVGKPYRSG